MYAEGKENHRFCGLNIWKKIAFLLLLGGVIWLPGREGLASNHETGEQSLKIVSGLTDSDSEKSPQATSLASVKPGAALDRIVAIVEAQIISDQPVQPQIITQSEVDDLIEPTLDKLRQKGEDFQLESLRKRGLDELIVRKLRDQKATQIGVTVADDDIDDVIHQVERKNKLPPGSLPEVLRREGVDYQRYRQQLGDQLMETRLIKRVIWPLIAVTDEELKVLYNQTSLDKTGEEEVHLGQILLEVVAGSSPGDVARVQEKARTLADGLRTGKSLASLAGQFSSDSSGLAGGDMGWFKKGELPENLEKEVFQLQQGEVSEPLRSAQGFHVIQMIERRSRAISTQEQTASYRYKARHILIKVDANRDENTALAKIRQLREKIMDGKPFDQLATQNSEDVNTIKDGGNLGWFDQGVMVEAFDTAVKSLDVGQVSQPVKTPFGWHLIKLEDKQSLSSNSFEAQRPMLEQRLIATKAKDRYKQWLRDLRLRAFVEFP
ncbi:MAG: Chaperone SurA [Magnetococcales bacterium]|nr:Chaperone SurA [Magnetococcales bacterium]